MDKKSVIKSFLKDDIDNWELAQNIYFLKNREDLLTVSQITMIETFLKESRDNQNIADDISDNFESLMFEHISNISKQIITYIQKNIPEFESGEVLKLAKYQHYINFKLSNDVIIQLRYDRYPYFNIKSIWVQFRNVDIMSENEMKEVVKKTDKQNHQTFKWDSINASVNRKLMDNNFFESAFDEKKTQTIANKHEVILKKLKELVKIYNIDLSAEI
ncbi:MAG: hypothetical protein U9P72_05925 [Campylobacterota bacterium]|nr:hypothetical protein [Campylobacterota bacterium]